VARPVYTVVWILLAIALVGLWLLPSLLFPRPGTNDAIVLSDLELPLVLLEIAGVACALALIRGPSATLVRLALGVFLLGVAVDLVIGFVVFGNLSNDRFGALLLLPVPIGVTGLVALVVGVATGASARRDIARGVVNGLGAAVVVGVWTQVRGARDWLLAPYGLDIVLLVLVLGVALAVLPGADRVRDSAPPG
jgi:hypothetical protein